MERPGTKISKACEPCRRRKIRCNGNQPCQLCQQEPTHCIYRAKARDRASARQTRAAQSAPNNQENDRASLTESRPLPSATPSAHNTPRDTGNHPADPEVYRGITATHTHSPDSSECAQLFYGPSSNFAFLQQLHKGILDYGRTRQPDGHGDHEGGEGLDMFVQRSIFFGTPPKIDSAPHARPIPSIDMVSAAHASVFLGKFKAVSLHLFPLFTEAELDRMFHDLYPEGVQTSMRPQEMALTLAVLALGALSTDATDLAEKLYEQAKTVALVFAEAVTLSMIQFSLLLADFQVNMGRPNSAYLHLGDASRRALAMGLNRETSRTASNEGALQKRRATMWCLYFHERWHSLTMGRTSALKHVDITCPYASDQPVLKSFCELARIAEANAEEMYLHKSESLQLLYAAAQRTHAQLRRFAEQVGIGSSDVGESSTCGEVSALHLHNVYYHTILLAFRPFLVTEALAGNHQKHGAMWLREACRHATDAAQDSLVYIDNASAAEHCRESRFTAFFIESSCAVLLYDSLWHRSKHAYNLEYIQTGLRCLERMANEEPVLNARTSISRMIVAVEQAAIGRSSNTPTVDVAVPDRSTAMVQHTPTQRGNSQVPQISETMFGSTANDFIYLSDRQNQAPAAYQSQQHVAPTNTPASFDQNIPMGDPMSLLDFDVLTTDLYNFFPISNDMNMGNFGDTHQN